MLPVLASAKASTAAIASDEPMARLTFDLRFRGQSQCPSLMFDL
jgi:hypothetical protein